MPKYKIRSVPIETKYADQTVIGEYRYVTIHGQDLKLPDGATGKLQLQHTFSHGGVNPAQGTSETYLVRMGDARKSVDIGYNTYPGQSCQIKNNWLVFKEPVEIN